MKKVRVCFGLGLNFAGVSHQVMSPASRWFSGCFGEGAWLALELLLMSCWFKGCLCFAFLSALLHTHHTHTQKKTPFPFPFSSESTVHVHCCRQWFLCGCFWSWCCSSEGANPVTLCCKSHPSVELEGSSAESLPRIRAGGSQLEAEGQRFGSGLPLHLLLQQQKPEELVMS